MRKRKTTEWGESGRAWTFLHSWLRLPDCSGRPGTAISASSTHCKLRGVPRSVACVRHGLADAGPLRLLRLTATSARPTRCNHGPFSRSIVQYRWSAELLGALPAHPGVVITSRTGVSVPRLVPPNPCGSIRLGKSPRKMGSSGGPRNGINRSGALRGALGAFRSALRRPMHPPSPPILRDFALQ